MDDPVKLYEISFEPRTEYLYAFVKGDLGASETKVRAWAEIIKRCREDERERLLVVQDSPGNATPADAFESSRDIVALGLSGIKIAFVDLDPANYENNQFGEMVAGNRGAFAKVFTTEAEAHNWLVGPARS